MKNVLTAMMLVVVMATATAQKFVPRIGVSAFKLTDVHEQDSTKIPALPGFTIGIGYQVRIDDRFSFQPELNFVQKGIKYDLHNSLLSFINGPVMASGTIKVIINYFEVPLLIKATFGSAPKFFILAGPYLGYGIGGKLKYDITTDDPDIGHVSGQRDLKFGERVEDHLATALFLDNRLDYGLQGGAGVLIADKVFVDIRYSLGLSDIQDGDDSKNRGLLFTVGVPFNIKK